MSTDPTRPDVGDLVIDARNLSDIIVDLPPSGRLGLRAAQPGCADALAEIRGNQTVFGTAAGIRDEDVEAINAALEKIAEIDALLPAASKLAELLDETRAVLDDSVQRRVFMIAQSVENRAKMLRDDDLLARYARTRDYRSAIGVKAARTRLRNLAIQEQEGDEPLSDPSIEPPPTSPADEPVGESS